MREDHFTNSEHDAGRYERMRAEDDYYTHGTSSGYLLPRRTPTPPVVAAHPMDDGNDADLPETLDRIILCGSSCGHDHNSINGPTGCCAEHGPYMYYCGRCQA